MQKSLNHNPTTKVPKVTKKSKCKPINIIGEQPGEQSAWLETPSGCQLSILGPAQYGSAYVQVRTPESNETSACPEVAVMIDEKTKEITIYVSPKSNYTLVINE
jgi:hypothetical protein